MKINFKKYTKIILLALFIFSVLIPLGVSAAEPTGYNLLTPLPGLNSTGVTLTPYLSRIFTLAISMAAILAVFYIVLGGIQYMSTDAWFEKKEGIDKIQNAAMGLLLVISAWLILNTINPDILDFNLKIKPTKPVKIEETIYVPNKNDIRGSSVNLKSLNISADKKNVLIKEYYAVCKSLGTIPKKSTDDILTCEVDTTKGLEKGGSGASSF